MVEIDVQVLQTDDYKTMANKIFNSFPVGTSCKILGHITQDTPNGKRIKEKGEAVWEYLEWLDKEANYDKNGKRKRKKLSDSIGGYVAQKIFRKSRVVLDDDIKWNIWRYQ